MTSVFDSPLTRREIHLVVNHIQGKAFHSGGQLVDTLHSNPGENLEIKPVLLVIYSKELLTSLLELLAVLSTWVLDILTTPTANDLLQSLTRPISIPLAPYLSNKRAAT